MGPNGSGKSTLGQTLSGNPLYRVSNPKSKILLDGKSLIGLEPEGRANLGLFLAFQNPVSIPGVSVINLLRIIKKINKKDLPKILHFNKEVESLCQEFGLSIEVLKRSVNDGFSGGEKKKLEMIQMLTFSPKYVVIDEIDTGLDVDSLKIVAQAVGRLRKKRTGILLITHYQRVLKYLNFDFVHVLIDGKIAKSGKKELANKIESKGYSDYLKKS